MSTSSQTLQEEASIDEFFNVVATETLELFEYLEFEFLYEFDVFAPASRGRTREQHPPELFRAFLHCYYSDIYGIRPVTRELQNTPDVLARIRHCVADCEDITIADVSWSVGTAEPPDSPLVEAVTSTAQAVSEEPVYRRSATSGGDTKQVRNGEIPTAEFSFGADTAHAVHEVIPDDALVDNALVYINLPWVFIKEIDNYAD